MTFLSSLKNRFGAKPKKPVLKAKTLKRKQMTTMKTAVKKPSKPSTRPMKRDAQKRITKRTAKTPQKGELRHKKAPLAAKIAKLPKTKTKGLAGKTRKTTTKRTPKPARRHEAKTPKRSSEKPAKRDAQKNKRRNERGIGHKNAGTGQKTVPKTAQGKTAKPRRPARVIDFIQQLKIQSQEDSQEAERKAIKYPVAQGAASERVAMLQPVLRDLVKRGIISDWIINLNATRSANIYVERNFTIEDELSGIREDVLLTIYERFPDGLMGEAQLSIITNDAAAAKAQILDAKAICAYTKKPAFRLPEPAEGIMPLQDHDPRLLDALFNGGGPQAARDIHQQIKAAMLPVADIKANCFEILLSASALRIVSSTGVDISFHKTGAYIELTLTCENKTEEREFITHKTEVSVEQLDLPTLLQQQMLIVRDATAAQQNPGFQGDVILSGQSVNDFFAPSHDLNPVVLHTGARLHHMGLSQLKIGQPIGHFQGEPFSISSNPALPLGMYTMPVDEEGTPLRTVELIRNGIFTNYVASARYAAYLGVPATGNIANIQVGAGATREEHLRGNNYFEIVSFSWFAPNPFSGDFAAEIRLGYRWQNGRKTPLRGGTLTGNVFKNLLNARFSKEIMQAGQYYGPRTVLLKNTQITKFE